jgi:hypothetical protein
MWVSSVSAEVCLECTRTWYGFSARHAMTDMIKTIYAPHVRKGRFHSTKSGTIGCSRVAINNLGLGKTGVARYSRIARVSLGRVEIIRAREDKVGQRLTRQSMRTAARRLDLELCRSGYIVRQAEANEGTRGQGKREIEPGETLLRLEGVRPIVIIYTLRLSKVQSGSGKSRW